jgi:hypothetical protein
MFFVTSSRRFGRLGVLFACVAAGATACASPGEPAVGVGTIEAALEAASPTVLVPRGSTWRFRDNGVAPASTWRTASYDDGHWRTGAAQLGYGDGDEITKVGFGSSATKKYATTWFRRTFQLAQPPAQDASLWLLVDDGAVVYLNGVEVFRVNMAAGSVTASTWANARGENSAFTVPVPASAFALGNNVLAVEVHQFSADSSDLSFDLGLSAVLTTPPPPPAPPPPAAGCSYPLPANGSPARGLWVWTSSVATNATAQASFFQFATTKGVRAAYVSSLGGAGASLGSFVKAAADRCIEVEWLAGDANWALTGNHAQAIAAAQQAVKANAALTGTKLTALHFDVEPYLLTQWSSDMNGTANQYLDLVEKLASVAHAAGLRLDLDVPFWWDTKAITRNGVTRPMSEWVADRADRLVLMDYTDTAAGILANGKNEVAYAAKTGKQVVIGVETICGLSPTSVTFCEEGEAAMEAALKTVQATWAGQPGFMGVAVHHYGSYTQLKP